MEAPLLFQIRLDKVLEKCAAGDTPVPGVAQGDGSEGAYTNLSIARVCDFQPEMAVA